MCHILIRIATLSASEQRTGQCCRTPHKTDAGKDSEDAEERIDAEDGKLYTLAEFIECPPTHTHTHTHAIMKHHQSVLDTSVLGFRLLEMAKPI